MNVLYLLGSVPNHRQLFINREIEELQRSGIQIVLLIINPFYEKGYHFKNLYKAGFNPLMFLLSPFLNYFVYKKSLLFSKSEFSVFKPFKPAETNALKMFMATLFLETALYKLLKSKTRIDHIHSHHLFSATLFTPKVAALTGADYSITIHTLSSIIKPEFLKLTLQKARFIRTVTTETQNYFTKNGFNERISYIPNAVDEASFPKRTLNPPQLSILAIGYFVDKKGFDVLIKSCHIIKSRGIDFNCTIIGEGPEGKLFKQLISQYKLTDCVTLVPYLNFEELIPYFQNSTVLAVPCRDPKRSTRDGLPTVILEAMAMGLPVVASDFAGISDAIIHEGTGLLVKSESESELAEGILRINTDTALTASIVKNAMIRVQENFSLKKNMAQLAELFNSKN